MKNERLTLSKRTEVVRLRRNLQVALSKGRLPEYLGLLRLVKPRLAELARAILETPKDPKTLKKEVKHE